MEALTSKDIESLSGYIYLRQTEHIAEALQEVSQRNNISRTVTTGLGMDIIGNMACELTSIPYVGMNQILTKEECVVAPAVGTAVLMEDYLKKR